MKRALLTFIAILMIASMLMVLASCGGSNTNSNGILPGDKLPAGTDFNKTIGTRFEFVVSADGYFGTEYNAQGNPIARRVYEFETMILPSDPVSFAYEYDAKGLLKGYSVKTSQFAEALVLTMTYDDAGRAISAKTTADGASISASWEYDKNGLIVSETLNMNGALMAFTYDSQGRIVKETVNFGGDDSGECVTTYTDDGAHQVAKMEGETVVDADYTFHEKGYPLSVKGNIGGGEVEITYTYNNDRCTASTAKYEEGAYKTETVYNDKNLVVSKTTAKYDENNTLEYKEVNSYEYDAAGNTIKEERKTYDADGNVTYRSLNTSTYNAKNQLLETTWTTYNDRGEIIGKDSTVYEYDSKGNHVKETYKSYMPDGTVWETRVLENTYDGKNLLVKTDEKHYQGTNLVHHEVREYNENGQVTKKTDYHVDKETSSESGRTEEIYSYDEKGFVSKNDRTEYGADGKMTGRFVNEFKDGMPVKFTEYDADGNVVHSEDYSGNMGNNGSTKPIPPQENGNANDKEDNNSTAPETEKKPVDTHPEEKPDEYLPGIDYNGDGVIDENDMPNGGASSNSNANATENDISKDETADHNGKAPENGAIGDTAVNGSITESVVKPAPNMGMVEDGYKYNDFINTKD